MIVAVFCVAFMLVCGGLSWWDHRRKVRAAVQALEFWADRAAANERGVRENQERARDLERLRLVNEQVKQELLKAWDEIAEEAQDAERLRRSFAVPARVQA